MTEFEAATVAFQQGTLAYQQASLALQQGQLEAARNIPLVAGLVGLGQILVVAAGIRVMRQMNRDRTRQVEAQMEAQRADTERREKREDARHAEAMRALEALIKGMEQQGETLRAAVKGMETVIERTAPTR